MALHTVRKLARLSGVSVRTLHHYDAIGLLKPALIAANGYRMYGEAQLLRLQQILLHRELGLALADIAALLDETAGDQVGVLKRHRAALADRAARYRELIATLDATIDSLEGEQPMKPEQLYRGFSPEKQAEHERWLVERHGPSMRQEIGHSRRHVGSWTDAQLQDRIRELATLEAALADHCRRRTAPADPQLRPLLERHRQWVASMWGRPCTPEKYAGLAGLYESHPDFRARYESLAPGFADYLPAAMRACSAQAA